MARKRMSIEKHNRDSNKRRKAEEKREAKRQKKIHKLTNTAAGDPMRGQVLLHQSDENRDS